MAKQTMGFSLQALCNRTDQKLYHLKVGSLHSLAIFSVLFIFKHKEGSVVIHSLFYKYFIIKYQKDKGGGWALLCCIEGSLRITLKGGRGKRTKLDEFYVEHVVPMRKWLALGN